MFTKIVIAVIATLGTHAIRLEPVDDKVMVKKEGAAAALATEQVNTEDKNRVAAACHMFRGECWPNPNWDYDDYSGIWLTEFDRLTLRAKVNSKTLYLETVSFIIFNRKTN